MANIHDVAKAAGVSIATVSATLNESASVSEETRRRVLAAVDAVGYAPNAIAQSLRRGRSRLIGLVVANISNPFCSTMVRTIERHAIAAGYSIIVCNTDDDAKRELGVLDQLRTQRVAGIVLTPVGQGATYVRHLDNRNLPPIVTVDQQVAHLTRDFVGVDNRAAARMLTEYLLRLGHRRIAIICGREGRWTSDERLASFKETLSDAGVPVDSSLCVTGNYDTELAYKVTVPMMTRANRPTAILAANNVMALGALQAINDLGFRCPEEISIVGIDDVPWGSLVRPRVTTVVQPVEEIAGVAIDWLLERIAAGADSNAIAPRTQIFAPAMIVGGSCAPPATVSETTGARVAAGTDALDLA